MSQKDSGFAKIPSDKYYTPAWVTNALLTVERFTGTILEPAAGGGAMSTVLAENLMTKALVFASDIDPDVPTIKQADFLTHPDFGDFDNIITNPPYGGRGTLAVKFIKRALDLNKPAVGKVAMLLSVDFDSAKSRRSIFGQHPAFSAKYALTRRIHWANLPLKYDASGSVVGGTTNHAWFVWDWRRVDIPTRKYGYLE